MSRERREDQLLGNGWRLQPRLCRLWLWAALLPGPAGAAGLMSAARAASEHQLCFLFTQPCPSGAGNSSQGGEETNSTGMQS